MRTQIQLPEDQHRRLRQWARRLGIDPLNRRLVPVDLYLA